MPVGAEKKDSICWTCDKACKGCKKPVDGWAADYCPSIWKDNGVKRKIDMWSVRWCPNYQPDRREKERLEVERQEQEEYEKKMRRIAAGNNNAWVMGYKSGIKPALLHGRMKRGSTAYEALTQEFGAQPKRRTKNYFTVDGETLSIKELAKKYKVDAYTIRHRMIYGKTPEEACKQQKKKYRHPVVAENIATGEKRWFQSQTAAAKELKVNQRNISLTISGKRNHTGGWRFKYE